METFIRKLYPVLLIKRVKLPTFFYLEQELQNYTMIKHSQNTVKKSMYSWIERSRVRVMKVEWKYLGTRIKQRGNLNVKKKKFRKKYKPSMTERGIRNLKENRCYLWCVSLFMSSILSPSLSDFSNHLRSFHCLSSLLPILKVILLLQRSTLFGTTRGQRRWSR